MPNRFVEPNTWIQGAENVLPRYGNISVAIDGDIYVMAGGNATNVTTKYADVQIYHSRTDTWTRGSLMPNPANCMGHAVMDNKIYCVGGRALPPHAGGSDEVVYDYMNIYDIEADQWAVGAAMPTARCYVRCVAANGQIYCFGGQAGGATRPLPVLDVVEIYDPATDTWRTGPKMPEPKIGFACFLHNHKIYCVGGYGKSAQDNTVQSFAILDLETEQWELGPDAPTARACASYILHDKRLYCISGYRNPGMDILDVERKQWVTGASPLTYGSYNTPCVILHNKIYLLGYADVDHGVGGSNYQEMQIYDIALNSWSRGPDMPRARLTPFDCHAIDGKIYCLNGQVDQAEQLTQLDIFVPEDGIPITLQHRDQDDKVLLSDRFVCVESGRDYTAAAPQIADYTCIGYKLDGNQLVSATAVTLEKVSESRTVTFVYKEVGDPVDPGPGPGPGFGDGGCCCKCGCCNCCCDKISVTITATVKGRDADEVKRLSDDILDRLGK